MTVVTVSTEIALPAAVLREHDWLDEQAREIVARVVHLWEAVHAGPPPDVVSLSVRDASVGLFESEQLVLHAELRAEA